MVFFFFFKQKTAYEIRNCDWSSDVCSSDLGLQSVGVAECGAHNVGFAECGRCRVGIVECVSLRVLRLWSVGVAECIFPIVV